MKQTILLTTGILLFTLVFSQSKTKEYYLEKSKKQKRTGWILLGTGAAAIVTGLLIEAPHRGTGNSQSATGGLVEVVGIACSLTSIPFFISSSKNKRRSASLSFNNREILFPHNNSLIVRVQPTVSLLIPLR